MEQKNETKTFQGLRKLPEDRRDYVAGSIFRSYELPPDIDFTVSRPLGIKEQKNSSMCVSFAVTAVSEDQEEVQLSPEWFYSKIKEIEGDSTTWGADLRTAMKAATKKGFIKQLDAMFSLDTNGQEFLADWNNWDRELDSIAQIHRKQSYLKITGKGYTDLFDAIRSFLWQFKAKNQSVVTGLEWCDEWTNAQGGVIRTKGTPSYGHAFKIFGQRMVGGTPYLTCQLSNGDDIGDKGIFYMSREVINTCEPFGCFMLVDLPRAHIEFLSYHNFSIDMSWLAKIVLKIRSFWK